MCKLGSIAAVALVCGVGVAQAADYTVPTDGTLDAVIGKAVDGDVIRVTPGTYETNAQWGPQLKAKLIGTGASRDDVVIKAQGDYRTLRTASTGWVENVTVVGNTDISKADKGAAIEMSGGTVTNCVIMSGAAYGNDSKYSGGNIYMNAGLVVDCEIKDGTGTKNGGNICMTGGTVKACTISNGSGGEGGSVYMTNGTISDCTILANGTTTGSGGGVYITNGTIADTTIDGTDGTMGWHGGCIYMKNGTVRDTICRNGVCTSTSGRNGGNVYMENGTLANVILENGTCTGEGGNLYTKGGEATGLVCRGGQSGSNGGNIRATEGASIADSFIEDGQIVSDGEAKGVNVYLDKNVKLVRTKVTGGTSLKKDGTTPGYEGGSICMWSGTALVDTCLVTGCARGGILSGTTGHVYGTTIVANGAFGYWAWNASQTLQNCVIYGNTKDGVIKEYAGNQPGGDNGSLVNCAMSAAGALDTAKYPTLVVMKGDSDFVDYANGDYRPTETSALTDAGADDARADASTKDLAGLPRRSEEVDIGCYEYQHSNMTVGFNVPTLDHAYTPATASFTATAANAPGAVTFSVDFGDGTKEDFATDAISHVYTTAGTFTITVVANSEGATSKPMTREVRIVDKVHRVGDGGHATIQAAVDASEAGCEVVISEGTYEITAPIRITKAITVKAEGADKVTIRNVETATSSSPDHRVMTVSGGATIENLVLENGSVYNTLGGCLWLEASTAANCVIRGGRVIKGDSGSIGGAGVVMVGTGAVLTHCTVTGNTVEGTPSNDFGGALLLRRDCKPAKVYNTLIADNTLICTEGAAAAKVTAGVMFGGANENSVMENCTVAGNRVVGALESDSAGLYCGSWSANFRNNVIAANFETAKGEAGRYTSAYIVVDHCTVVNTITDDEEPLKANNFVAKADEMFKNVADRNYQPKTQGALWNRGTAATSGETTDLLGKPRVMFDVIDLGCYEAQYKLGFAITIR